MVQLTTEQKETVYLGEIVLLFAVLCYLADREVIIIPPLTQLKSQVSQRTFKTKGLISIEILFLGHPVCRPTVHLFYKMRSSAVMASRNLPFADRSFCKILRD